MSITAPPASSTVASVIPLITTFTPAPLCLNNWYTVPFTVDSHAASYYRLGVSDISQCMPTGWNPTSYFSPGLCPDGYTIATSSVDNTITETRADCCPGGFEINSNTSTYLKEEKCMTVTTTQYYYSKQTNTVYAPAVSIRWRSNDFSESSLVGTSKEKSSQLSISAKIGIGIGVTLGLLVAVILGFSIFYLQQFRDKSNDQESIAAKSKSFLNTLSYWRIMILDSWLYEIIAICFSVASFVAMCYILKIYDQQRQPRFSYGLTLNTVISILSTASKTSLIFLVGECIGQLRWASFRKRSNPLGYLQTYDSASRGPWGSILILIRDKCQSPVPVTIGAIVTIFALAFDPFVQQIITYDVRLTQVFSDTVKVKQSRYFSMLGGAIGADSLSIKFQSALSTAVWTRQTSLDPTCPSGNCTWPLFTQLEVCNKCEDVTHRAALTGCDNLIPKNNVNQTSCHITIPGSDDTVAVDLWPKSQQTTMDVVLRSVWPSYVQNTEDGLHFANGTSTTSSNAARVKDAIYLSNQTYAGLPNPLLGFAYAELEVPDNATVSMGPTELVRGLRIKKATTCGLSFCARTYNMTVSSGVTSSKVIHEDFGEYYLSHLLSEGQLTCWKSNPGSLVNKTQAHHVIKNHEQNAVDSGQFDFCVRPYLLGKFDLAGGLRRIFYCSDDLCLGGTYANSGQSNSSDVINQSGPPMKALQDGLENTVSNIASSLTHYARDMSDSFVLGTMGVANSYVHVRWLWLILPAVLIALGVILLASTAFISMKLKLWKTSVLPFLYHGLDKGLIAEGEDFESMSQMEGAADALNVSLDYSATKHRLMLRDIHEGAGGI